MVRSLLQQRDQASWLAVPAGAMVLAFYPVEDGPTVCPFALVTGTACPGCGLTRATALLLRGRLGPALDYHPLAPLVTAVIVALWMWAPLRRMGLVPPMPRAVANTGILLIAALLVLVWAVRLSSGSLPPV